MSGSDKQDWRAFSVELAMTAKINLDAKDDEIEQLQDRCAEQSADLDHYREHFIERSAYLAEQELRQKLDSESAQQQEQIAELERRHIAPTDSGVKELDDMCRKFNEGEIDLCDLVCRAWNTALIIVPTPPTSGHLEPNGGNLYRNHVLQIHSGEFWRCKHGLTGLDGPNWIGCDQCKAEDPDAYAAWRKTNKRG